MGILANPFTDPQFNTLSIEKKAAAAEAAKSVLASLDERKQDYIELSGADEWSVARLHARILAQNIEMRSGPLNTMITIRDRSMAENIGWILDHEGPDAKLVAWAHNGHVSTQTPWMGSHLRRMFGSEMVVFGFAFNQGGFQAMEMPFPTGGGLRSFNVGPAPDGSLDAMLASVGLNIAAIDLRELLYDFQVVTSDDRPHSGKACALISRAPGKHYGEIVGSFTQRLDATRYRGKKIRLRAAARAEVPGMGNMSWLRLNVAKKSVEQGFGTQTSAFDSLDKYPVTSAEWRIFEIVSDVPMDADSISYGLYLTGDGKAWLDSVSLEIVE